MVNKHAVNYHLSPSQLISRIHPLIFPWTLKVFISPESFLKFFLNLYIPSWWRKSFKFIVLRLLANTFVSQKIESVHFYLCTQAKISPRFLSLPPRQKEIIHSAWTAFSEDLFFSQQKGEGEIMEMKKLLKLNPRGYWSQILINCTIFATFTFLVNVLLYHNLPSSMLKCEGPLTELIKFSLKSIHVFFI